VVENGIDTEGYRETAGLRFWAKAILTNISKDRLSIHLARLLMESRYELVCIFHGIFLG
jgi:hypothetical protein